ncbi:MAG: hypothetical protein Ct9H300mP3_00450 [Gammaproteobacteria bacterium]|nr:MAG: hypothetical protein Ct9H300mP3_00450 [Gammaproteobacteria bacterium]
MDETHGEVYDKVIWLNPVPSDHWEYSASVELTRSLIEDNMFPPNHQGPRRQHGLSKQIAGFLAISNPSYINLKSYGSFNYKES